METLNFKIELDVTFWDKKPEYKILLNDVEKSSGHIDKNTIIEFDTDLEDNAEHKLEIKLLNKEYTDTLQSDDKSEILKDMLLHVKQIMIDNIPLDYLIYSKSQYVPFDNSHPTLDKCVDLGWNGTYILTFSTPFYIWLLENM
jgi:hypothetical protein